MMQNHKKNNGFTLVELMVSVGITAILMMGLATFFSSTFQNMFIAREKETNTQEKFVVNTILNGKFVNVAGLQELGPAPGPMSPYAVLQNDMDTGDLPFTFIGKATIDGANHIVFKDFFVFNGRDGSESSYGAVINNPGGMAQINDDLLIAAPLEDKIYKCVTKDSCPAVLDLSALPTPLDQPMDITWDGTSVIYVTDAGNNRIIKITDPGEPSQSAEELDLPDADFNYPTGIDHYQYGGIEYLFVADTYNHVVKKITLPNGPVEVVVGAGDDEVCDPSDGRDHTAYFCKLRFPTGVLAENLMGLEQLYIADTGNGRVLHIWDPYWDSVVSFRGSPDLSKLELKVTLPATQVKNIDFVFPDSIVLSPDPIEEAAGNTLHKGLFANDVHTVRFTMQISMAASYTENEPTCIPNPDPEEPDICTDHWIFKGFDTNLDENIFQNGDSIEIDNGNFYTVSSVDGTRVFVDENDQEVSFPAGTTVKVMNDFPSGEYLFTFDLSLADFASGFNLVRSEAYDYIDTLKNDPEALPDFVTLRIGDGKVGTFEDVIEVFDFGDFPTGVSWFDGVAQASLTPQYDTDFSASGYDYVSDFEVDAFGFTELGDVLEMQFNAKLGKDAEGNPIWEENTLNANIKE